MSLPSKRNTYLNESKRTHLSRESISGVPLHQNTARRSIFQRMRWAGIFLVGIIMGIILTLLFLLLFSFDHSTANSTSPSNGSITAEISRAYLTQLVRKQLKTSSLPGNISNVQVTLAGNNLMTVSGDDQFDVLGLSITKHFALTLQLSVVTCQLHVKVIHADVGGIPVTGFAALFENQLNQQLHSQQSDFPSGFTYCLSGVQTTTNNVVLTYSAIAT